MQFGTRPDADETLDDTRAIFPETPHHTCTEAFFNDIHHQRPASTRISNLVRGSEAAVGLLQFF
jgi:hypothetical protein